MCPKSLYVTIECRALTSSSLIKSCGLTYMFQLRRMNALTPAQAIIMAKLAREEPVSPKSLAILNAVFT